MGERRGKQYQRMRTWLKWMLGTNLLLVALAVGLAVVAVVQGRRMNVLSAELESMREQTENQTEPESDGGNIRPEESESGTEEEATTAAPRNYIVCLDAGHGGQHGATSTIDGRFESDDTLRLTLAVQKALEQYSDVTVVMTRTEDVHVELEDRSRIANEAKADLFVSFHRNSNTVGDKGGVEGWIHSSNPEDSRAAGEMILAAMEEVGVTFNFGVKSGTWDEPDANYKIIRLAEMPAVLLEVGYLNYAKDNELFDRNLEGYAQAAAEAIYEWLGEWTER